MEDNRNVGVCGELWKQDETLDLLTQFLDSWGLNLAQMTLRWGFFYFCFFKNHVSIYVHVQTQNQKSSPDWNCLDSRFVACCSVVADHTEAE